jgi:hypothetical protein
LSRNGSVTSMAMSQTDLQEFRAGTDPTNSDSIFRVLTVTPLGGGRHANHLERIAGPRLPCRVQECCD